MALCAGHNDDSDAKKSKFSRLYSIKEFIWDKYPLFIGIFFLVLILISVPKDLSGKPSTFETALLFITVVSMVLGPLFIIRGFWLFENKKDQNND